PSVLLAVQRRHVGLFGQALRANMFRDAEIACLRAVCRPATLEVAVVYLKCEIRDGVGLVKLALFDSDFSGGVRHGQGASIQCGELRRDRYPKKRPASTKGRNVGCGRITRSHVVRRTTENGTSWKFAAGWTGAAHATGIGRGASACRAIKPAT